MGTVSSDSDMFKIAVFSQILRSLKANIYICRSFPIFSDFHALSDCDRDELRRTISTKYSEAVSVANSTQNQKYHFNLNFHGNLLFWRWKIYYFGINFEQNVLFEVRNPYTILSIRGCGRADTCTMARNVQEACVLTHISQATYIQSEKLKNQTLIIWQG